ncbi:MAG TPA: radical SAM protein [Phycisphaerales bacterium]|nr:radical SAM protein [Phycisphaerales bacterium]
MRVTLVVDITYRCNARCRYCRWGDGRTGERRDRPTLECCADEAIIRRAGVDRVVFSGGEPLLNRQLNRIVAHYVDCGVSDRIVITNGLIASAERLEACRQAGATGFAFSIDGADEASMMRARAMSREQMERIFDNLTTAAALAQAHGLELTVNCVLSAANCSLTHVQRLVQRCEDAGAAGVKFQPVFDDGYMGVNAPDLRLRPEHAPVIRAIERDSARWKIKTNSPRFFADIARCCEGEALDGRSCGLEGRTLVLQDGGLVICPWVSSRARQRPTELVQLRVEFRDVRESCDTGAHCFCLQPHEQAWMFRNGNA